MKLRYLATAVVLAQMAVAAHAQSQTPQGVSSFGLYLNPIATRVSNSVTDSGPFAFLGANSTSRTFWGVDYGVLYDFYRSGKLTTGVDLRGSDLHANNASLKDVFVGVRISGAPFTRPIKPYLQGSVGLGLTKAPSSTVSIHKLDYRIFAGADYTLQRHIDFRMVEVGYGALTTVSSATVGGGGTIAIPSSRMLSVSSGLIFRF